jgi:uncharacterized protein
LHKFAEGGNLPVPPLIEAAKAADIPAIEQLLMAGADVNVCDEHGWTALHWSAGKGDAAVVKLLLERGANVAAKGRDNRTALLVARAARRSEAVELLVEAFKKLGARPEGYEPQPYCKAMYLRELRRYPGWSESASQGHALNDDSIVYLHQDFTVTRSMWHNEQVLFDKITPEWKTFCARAGFSAEEDLFSQT